MHLCNNKRSILSLKCIPRFKLIFNLLFKPMWSFLYPFSENSTFTERTQILHSLLTGLFAMATETEAHGYCSIKSSGPCTRASWPMTAPKHNPNNCIINLYFSRESCPHGYQPTHTISDVKTRKWITGWKEQAKGKIFSNHLNPPTLKQTNHACLTKCSYGNADGSNHC